jgi:cathepsin L
MQYGHSPFFPPRCVFNASAAVTTLVSYKYSPTGDEEALRAAVYNDGPPAVVVDGSRPDFQLYTTGIYDPEDCSSVDLGNYLYLVGYAARDGTPYWLLQNSWGSDWGEEGYIRMIRNAGNKCGVATKALFPIDQV